MALINCKECNTEVSDNAKHCIKCGAPIINPNKITFGKVVVFILVAIMPPLFVWFLLLKKFSEKERMVGFVWFGFCLFLTVLASVIGGNRNHDMSDSLLSVNASQEELRKEYITFITIAQDTARGDGRLDVGIDSANNCMDEKISSGKYAKFKNENTVDGAITLVVNCSYKTEDMVAKCFRGLDHLSQKDEDFTSDEQMCLSVVLGIAMDKLNNQAVTYNSK